MTRKKTPVSPLLPFVRCRRIIHLDMDAFYAAIEQNDNPELRGKPVIVGGAANRGVVSAASYEARAYGIRSALPIVTARKLCPEGVFLPVRMSRYQEISQRIMAIFEGYTPLVEPLSLDEAFLDVTDSEKLFGAAAGIASEIRGKVLRVTGLTVSAGVACSKLLAKIASDLEKPDGLTIVPPGGERAFLAPLPIRKLWGVGGATQRILRQLNVFTIGDLSRVPVEILKAKCGDTHGMDLHYASKGMDGREVVPEREAKSVGAEETFDHDIRDMSMLERELLGLTVRVARRLRRHGLTGKTITLKIKYPDFTQITRSATLRSQTNDQGEFFRRGCEILRKTLTNALAVRLLGVSVSQLFPARSLKQLSLFVPEGEEDKITELNRALDRITEKFGGSAINPARLFEDGQG